jgi:hypothetical protein
MSFPPPPAAKKRPGVRWFVVGGLLLVLAVAAFVVGLVLTLKAATHTDTTFSTADGPATVEVEAGTDRMLFVPSGSGSPDCTVEDGSGARTLENPSASTTVTTGGDEWVGFATFDSGDGDLTITCDSAAPVDVRVGPPLGAGFVVGLLLTILLPLVLGLSGFGVLVVTTVLFVTRRPGPDGAQA